jgi:hypothetical protein
MSLLLLYKILRVCVCVCVCVCVLRRYSIRGNNWKACLKVGVRFDSFLTSAQDGDKWLALRPGPFTPEESVPCTQLIEVYEFRLNSYSLCPSLFYNSHSFSEFGPDTNNTVYKTGHSGCGVLTVGRQAETRM